MPCKKCHWSSDVERDERVRAEEDNRQRRLPTRAEAIGEVFPTKEATVSGLRTEMVILEPLFSRRNAMAAEAVKWCDDAGVERRPVNIVTALFSLGLVALPSEPALPDVSDQDGDRVAIDWQGLAKVLQSERDAAIRERDAAIKERDRWCAQSGIHEEAANHATARTNAAVIRVGEVMLERDAAIRERDRIRENAKADHNIAKAACDERDAAIRERDNERLVRIGTETDRDFARREKDAAIFHITELRTERDKLKARVAELEAASGGGEQEPVGFFAQWLPGNWDVEDQTFNSPERAQRYIDQEQAEDDNPKIVPLYAAPPPPRGWLTRDEIAVCVGLRDYCRSTWETWGRKDHLWRDRAAVLNALLARSTPPEVVLPSMENARGFVVNREEWVRRADVLAALAAQGVAVKEVGA